MHGDYVESAGVEVSTQIVSVISTAISAVQSSLSGCGLNDIYGMTAADTLKAAQSLYEKKLITYPRTAAETRLIFSLRSRNCYRYYFSRKEQR